MAVSISAEVTRTWPTTEASLTGDGDVDYATQKTLAIERAKVDLYGSATVPDEADIPIQAGYWIADQAVVHLIPLAIDFYMSKQRLSDSKEGATISFYNKVRALQELRNELEASLAAGKPAALDAIDGTTCTDDVPAVSTAGMAVDPLARAMQRGPAPW